MKISIVTVSLNEDKHIKRTIESVKNQTYKDIEHIFVDGLSTDDTIDIIRSYGHTPIIRRPKGIYNAMNHGTVNTTGDYVLYLNANDWLVNNKVIENVVKLIRKYPDRTLYYGRKINYDCNMNRKGRTPAKDSGKKEWSDIGRYIPHGGCFIKREYMIANPYIETLKIYSDRFTIADVCLLNETIDIKIDIINFYKCGLSTTLDKETRLKEFYLYKDKYIE